MELRERERERERGREMFNIPWYRFNLSPASPVIAVTVLLTLLLPAVLEAVTVMV